LGTRTQALREMPNRRLNDFCADAAAASSDRNDFVKLAGMQSNDMARVSNRQAQHGEPNFFIDPRK
jgi:hypothetical protein